MAAETVIHVVVAVNGIRETDKAVVRTGALRLVAAMADRLTETEIAIGTVTTGRLDAERVVQTVATIDLTGRMCVKSTVIKAALQIPISARYFRFPLKQSNYLPDLPGSFA